SRPSPSRSPSWPAPPGTKATTSASSSCSGSSRNRSKRSPSWTRCSPWPSVRETTTSTWRSSSHARSR
ncbi:hypothetical protein H2200_013672, partial [Cladophialophora chaetospira]